MKRYLVAGAAVLVAVPVLAQSTAAPPAQPPRPAMEAQTRAQVEARVRERLGAMDADRNGTVSAEEARASIEARTKARADARFAAMDTDKNGSISRAEFDAARAGVRVLRFERRNMGGGTGERRMMRMGDGMGRMAWAGNGDGIAIEAAVKRALERFDAADANKDGTLTPEERRNARQAMRAKWRALRSST